MLAGPPPTDTEVRQVFDDVLARSAAGENPAVIPCYGFDTIVRNDPRDHARALAPGGRPAESPKPGITLSCPGVAGLAAQAGDTGDLAQ